MRASAFPLALLLAGACSPRNPPQVPDAPRLLTLSVVSTNDVHGQLERLPFVAGFVRNLRNARAKDGGVLLVDAGDAFQGTIESNLNEGAAIIAAFQTMGYASLSLGNHEFDFGPAGPASIPVGPEDPPHGALALQIAAARFPVLAANLVTAAGTPPPWKNLSPSTEVVIDGVHVGIVGLLTLDAPDVIKRPNFAGLRVTPLAEAATREARVLRERGATVVIVVAHAGGACQDNHDPADLTSCDGDSEIFRLARELPVGLVDGIFGGHRNATVAKIVHGIPVVHAASNLVAFSRVDFSIDGKSRRVVAARIEEPRAVCEGDLPSDCRPGGYAGAPVVPDGATRAAIEPALLAASTFREQPLGVRVEAPFPAEKSTEMALGNLFADLMREAVPGAEAAFGNAGSVRDLLPAGDLTFGRLHHVMPFDNQLAQLRVTGKQLRALVTANLTQGEHGLLSVSGVTVDAVCKGPTLEVTLKHPDGAAVRDDALLTVATSDYLALGGDGLLAAAQVVPETATLDPTLTVLRVIIDGLAKRGSIRPDKTLFDPAHPRMKLPGPFPVRCGGDRR